MTKKDVPHLSEDVCRALREYLVDTGAASENRVNTLYKKYRDEEQPPVLAAALTVNRLRFNIGDSGQLHIIKNKLAGLSPNSRQKKAIYRLIKRL